MIIQKRCAEGGDFAQWNGSLRSIIAREINFHISCSYSTYFQAAFLVHWERNPMPILKCSRNTLTNFSIKHELCLTYLCALSCHRHGVGFLYGTFCEISTCISSKNAMKLFYIVIKYTLLEHKYILISIILIFILLSTAWHNERSRIS